MDETQQRRRGGPTLHAIMCGILVAASYSGVLRVGFFSDDYTWLGRMAATVERPGYAFSVFFRDFNPVLHASFVVDWLAGGGGALSYHITSLLVHALSAALLLVLCRRLRAKPWVATAAALCWALNVRLSEAVIWPAARGHSLATLSLLASLVCITGSGRWRVWGSAAFFLLAILSKEVAVLPLLAAPLLLGRRRFRLLDFAPHLVLAILFVGFNLFAKPSAYNPSPLASLTLKLPFLLLRPLGLGDLYTFAPMAFAIFTALFTIAVILLRRTIALGGFAWLLLTALPILPLEKLSSRYLYLLAIGYAFVLCGAWDAIDGLLTTPRLRRIAVAAGTTAIVALLAGNVLLVQREVEDYRLLSQPYQRCLEILETPAMMLQPGDTLIIVDTSPRDAVRAMTALVRSRGTMTKLLPYRARGVEGLIELHSALNVLLRGTGGLAVPADIGPASRRLVFVYDGRTVVPATEIPEIEPTRIFAARLATPEEYFKTGV
ncbi:MAG: hypothetical protein HYX75_04730 [Acidobacteria bacterium]|nr:hypothetical protein [Acidobacteriota bacterium]